MRMDFSKYSLPEIYQRQGKKCYLDPIRKQLIFITPEETIRQQVVSYLIKNLKIPKNMIDVEEPLRHYGLKSSRLRADIIINYYNKEDKVTYPLAVIECKAPDIFLGDKERNQIFQYVHQLGCNYAVLTNGDEVCCYKCDNNKVPVNIGTLPQYKEMLQNKYVELPLKPKPPHTPFGELEKKYKHYIKEGNIGKDTVKEKAIPMINFLECLLDCNYKMPIKQYKIFRLIKDYGIRELTYGNASGGSFFGKYRSFLVDFNGSTEFVSISVLSYFTWAHQDINKTGINVAIDKEKSAHHSLELSIDDNMMVFDDVCELYHSGRITIGNIGSGKIDELREFVRREYPQIIQGKRFFLGKLTFNRLWYMNDKEIVTFVENLISYGLIRDEYRKYVKNRH